MAKKEEVPIVKEVKKGEKLLKNSRMKLEAASGDCDLTIKENPTCIIKVIGGRVYKICPPGVSC